MTTSFFLENNVLVFPKILTHKSGWNGTICTEALSHKCNPANQDFRRNHCAKGMASCSHMHIFDSADPYLRVKIAQLPYVHIDILNQAFNDQLIVFHAYAPEGYETRHIVNNNNPSTMIGLYRIKEIIQDPLSADFYVIRPYKDSWIRFPKLVSHHYRWSETDDRMGNIKSLSSHDLKDLLCYMKESNSSYYDPKDEDLLIIGLNKIDDWLKISNKCIAQANDLLNKEMDAHHLWTTKKSATNRMSLENNEVLKNFVVLHKEPEPLCNKLPESIRPQWQDTINHLSEKLKAQFYLAWSSKPLIILSGEPGSGKSQIARNLVKPEHRCIVSVSSSFTSQEDLFGYYNPVSSKFQGFPLISFLIQCEEAWLRGDKTDRVVVLEEMNIAQPEHYMSDILTKSQYPEDDTDARTISFSSAIEGHSERSSVMLSPAIKFVGTVNTDHSVRKLTQRVLDRAAVVKIEITPGTILTHLALKDIPNTLTQCLTNLNTVLDGRYRFSYRTGTSLGVAMEITRASSSSSIDSEDIAFRALDLVLVQEVWPRISASLRSDFQPERILENLNKWIGEYSECLQHSASILDDWNMRLEQGINIDTLGV